MEQEDHKILPIVTVKVIKVNRSAQGIFRIWLDIGGKIYRRGYMTGFAIFWMDLETGLYLLGEEQNDLESIFKAWWLENNLDENKLLEL